MRVRTITRLVSSAALAAAMLGSAPASAQTPNASAPPAQAAPAYLIPGAPTPARPVKKGGHKPPRATSSAAGTGQDGRAVATLPGFKMLEGGASRLYVEVSQSVAVEQNHRGNVLTFKLKNTRVPLRNNRNALVTLHFNTPVATARLLPEGRDVVLVVVLRAPTTQAERVVPAEGGAARVEIDFPAGNFPAPPITAAPGDAPKPAAPETRARGRAAKDSAPRPANPVGPPAP